MLISKRNLIYFLECSIVVFLSLRLESVQYLTSFGTLYLEIPIILVACLLLTETIVFRSLSPIIWSVLIYFLTIIFATYINGGNIHVLLMNICPSLSMCIFADYNMRKNPHEFAENVGNFLLILILLDLFSIVLYPNGLYSNSLYSDNWILGFKTQRANVAVPAIALLATESYTQYKKLNFKVWLIILASFVASYLCESTAGMLGIIFEVIYIILNIYAEKENLSNGFIKIITNKWLLIFIIILVDILITVMNNVSIFEPFIVETLGKDISFTGRTVIWAASISLILKKPLLGSGFLDSTRFISLTGNYGGTQPHNLFLAILVYSGVIGLFWYIVILWKSVKDCDKQIDGKKNGGYIFHCCLISNLIIGITSMNAYTAFNVASLVILYHYNKLY